MVYCRCWPWRALAVALPWYLLLYNLPLSDSMFDSHCSTVSNMRTELISGWFKNVCFSSMCVYMCECVTARFYPSFLPVNPPTDTKLEQPCHLLVLTFVSLFFSLRCANIYSQMIIQMLEFVLLWWHWLESTRVQMNPNVIHFLVQTFVQGCSISVECAHLTSRRHVWDGKSGKINC